jgi:hypothetical protein
LTRHLGEKMIGAMADPLVEPFAFERANGIQQALRRFAARDRVETEGDRRSGIWEKGLRVYPGWPRYDRRACNRRIAVFVLEPV